MSTFPLFPMLPKEMRLKIYEDIFEARILQLGVDAGVPFPPELELLGARIGPTKHLHNHLPSLFAVCRESRVMCKYIFVAFGPTFIHPRLDTLYISLYAVGRIITTAGLKGACCNDDGEGWSTYPVAAFEKVAIEYGMKDLPKDLGVEGEAQDLAGQTRGEGVCAPGFGR